MVVLIVILVLIILMVLWIIFAPINIRVNTADHIFSVSQTGTVNMSFYPNETQFIKLTIFGFQVDMKRNQKRVDKQRTKKRQRGIRKSLDAWMYLINGIVKSFQCKKFECTVDFDDVVLNAQLYPVLYLVSRGPVKVSTNFEGHYYMDIFIQGHIYSILWTTIRFFTKK